ncbi:sphinganine kinase lcb4 [Rhizina undulata]
MPAPQFDNALMGLRSNTLKLGKKLSLTIEKDSLTISDEKTNKASTRSCCGLDGGAAKQRSIPLYEVLWAELGDASIILHFAEITKSNAKPATLTYPLEPDLRSAAEQWVKDLIKKAYQDSDPAKRLKVVINPFGGQGKAEAIFHRESEPLFEAAHCELDVENTLRNGHAIEIAESLDIDAYDAVVCCSGDGLPHEVFNGFGRRKDAQKIFKKIAVCQLPGGSGNAMCWNLTGTGSASLAALAIIKGVRKPLDLVSITQGDNRILSFLSQSVGIIAECDLGTEHLRWMGSARFTYGLLERVFKQTVYPCDIAVKAAIDDKQEIREHYRQGGRPQLGDEKDDKGLPPLQFGDINSPLPSDWELVHHAQLGNFYAGNMAWMSEGANFFPASLPNDGMFDLVCIDGTLNRVQAVKTLLAVETGSHFNMPHVTYRKVLGYRIIPHKREGVTEEYISIDGERVPFEPMQAEVHEGLATVLAKGRGYEAPGV